MALDEGLSPEEALKVVQFHSRDNVRTPMQWTTEAQAGFTTGTPWLPVHEDFASCCAEVEEKDDQSVLSYYRQLQYERFQGEAAQILLQGSYEELLTDDESIYAFKRTLGDESLLVLVNFTNDTARYDAELVRGASVLLGNFENPKAGKLRPAEAVIYRIEENMMLKVAASDYDGTLFRDDIITAFDADAVRQWRAAGHKFGVVSGRDHGMLWPSLYITALNTIICLHNGGLFSDGQNQVLWEARIEPALLKKASGIALVRKSFHFSFSSEDKTYLCHDLDGTWVRREAAQWNYPLVTITEDDIEHLPQIIHQFSLGFTTRKMRWLPVKKSTPTLAM